MKSIEEKSKLTDFTDRELMELLLSNQVIIYREIQRTQKLIRKENIHIGTFEKSFKELVRHSVGAIPAMGKYLKDQDADYE